MEEILTQAFSTGDLKIVIAALVVYYVVYFQRNETKKSRDNTQDDFDKRLTMIEHDVERLKSLDLETKLAQIQTDLAWIKDKLSK